MDYTGLTTPKHEKTEVRLTKERIIKMCFHVWRQFDDQYYAGFAAQIAYFFFMSSIPMIIVVTQFLGLFDVSTDFIRSWLVEHLSTHMSAFLESLFSASSAAVTNVFMIILVLWASSSLAFSLSRLSTYTLTGGRYRFNFLKERFVAIILGLLAMLVVVSSLLVYVYGEMIAHRIFKSTFAVEMIARFKTPVLAALFFIVILAFYYLLPRIRVPLAAVLPGSIVATVGIMIITWVYSLYIEKAVGYNLLYGAFSNIVALLLWYFFISWALCIGMMFNKSWDIHMQRGRLKPEKMKDYIYAQYGEKGPEMYNKLIIGEYDMYDKSLDTAAVRFSRKYDPGYNEKREREIKKLREEQRIRDKVERQMREEIETSIYDDAGNVV